MMTLLTTMLLLMMPDRPSDPSWNEDGSRARFPKSEWPQEPSTFREDRRWQCVLRATEKHSHEASGVEDCPQRAERGSFGQSGETLELKSPIHTEFDHRHFPSAFSRA